MDPPFPTYLDANSADARHLRQASRHQDAVRLLFLLDRAGTRPPADAPPGSFLCIQGQARLQALDFWVRNPDYLAEELLNEFEAGRMGDEAITLAGEILESSEPEIRCFPMVRWLYGAYEPLDDALSVLKMPGFLKIRRRGSPERVHRHDYFLLESGHRAADALITEASPLKWYADRADLVGRVAGNRGGSELKDRQYQQWEYGATALGKRITGIRDRVHQRLQGLRAA